MFLHIARFCSPLLSSNLQVSKTQGIFLGYEKKKTMIEANLLCTSQQGYEITFALLNWCVVPCNECH
jgi:hypothetical protein